MDEKNRFYRPPTDGLIVTQNFADKMNIRKGDVVLVKSPLLPEDGKIRVTEVIRSNFGSGCYMDAEALADFLRLPPFANVAVLQVDARHSAKIKEKLAEGGNIASVADARRILGNYESMMASYAGMIWMVLLMAILIAFAVIYNISGISLAERRRELATMRVLGMTASETAEVMTFEHWVLFAAAVAAGVPLAILFRQVMALSFSSDLYAMPTDTPFWAYLYSAAGCGVSVWLSNLAARGKIKRFSLVEVLKERE
jgi:putative ABC transport system permease protein